MKRALLIGLVLLVLLTPTSGQAAACRDEPIPLFVGIGQSLMSGTVPLPASQTPIPGAVMLLADNTWTALHEPSNINGASGYSPMSNFGRQLMLYSGLAQAGFINCAVGGSAVTTWTPGAANFEACWSHIEAAEAQGYYVAGVIVSNGETETANSTLAGTYIGSMWTMYYALAIRLDHPDLPFVFAKLGQTDGSRPAWNTVRDFQQNIYDQVGRPTPIAVASMWGVPRAADGIHDLDVAAVDERGRRFANWLHAVLP
jgi:hypothetical protein